MKILNLIIKQVYFDKILSGEKTEEYREVKPTNIGKLLQLDEDGYEIEDEFGNAQPIEYDAIRFFVGYNKNRSSALVEVKDAICQMFTQDVYDEDGNIVLDENGEPKQELIEYEFDKKLWYKEQVVYFLGEVLEKNISEE